MVQRHCSTVSQRVQWVSELVADSGSYGLVSDLSRSIGVSRQMLYEWKAKGQAGLEQALTPASVQSEAESTKSLERAILTLLVEGHASYRGIQRCVEMRLRIHVSVGKIAAVVKSAGQRAQQWISRHARGLGARAGIGRTVWPYAWASLSQYSRCPQWSGLGQHQSGRSRWGELDAAAVATGGARLALAYRSQ